MLVGEKLLLTLLTQAAENELEKHLTSVRHEMNPSVATSTTFHSILLLVDHHDGSILLFLRHLDPLEVSTMVS